MYATTLTLVLLAAGTGQIDTEYLDSEECCESECGNQGRGHKAKHQGYRSFGRGMPQTCYSPRYGCYSSNNRHMHRYPAFHGVYYRRPYNYRNLFDYPWHAEQNEPTSLFSYETPEEPIEEVEVDNADQAPRPPVDNSVSRSPSRSRTSIKRTSLSAKSRPTRLQLTAKPKQSDKQHPLSTWRPSGRLR